MLLCPSEPYSFCRGFSVTASTFSSFSHQNCSRCGWERF